MRSCGQDSLRQVRLPQRCSCLYCMSLHGRDLPCVLPVEHLTFLPWSQWRNLFTDWATIGGLIAGPTAKCCCGCLLDFKINGLLVMLLAAGVWIAFVLLTVVPFT